MKKYILLLPLLCFPLHVHAQDIDFGDIDIGDDDAHQPPPPPSQNVTKNTQPVTKKSKEDAAKIAKLKAKKMALLQDMNYRLRVIEMTMDMPVKPSIQDRKETKEFFLMRDNDKRLTEIEKVFEEPGTQLIRHNSLEENVRDVRHTIQDDDLMDINSRPVYTN